MTTKKGMALLEDVLDAYGGDRTRWPAPVRLELSQLLSASPEAQARLAEAAALDRLLDLAPTVSADRTTVLAERIMAQAARTPRMAASHAGPVARPRPAPVWKRHAAGISALAASLVIGLFAGQSQTMAPAVTEIASVVGIDSVAEATRLATTDETDAGIDEDLL